MKRISFAVLSILLLFFIGCKQPVEPIEIDQPSSLNKGPGGGHTELLTNNLSFPGLLADGYSLTKVTSPTFLSPYTGEYPALTEAEKQALILEGPWYPQKTDGNIWQADFDFVTNLNVDYIDWGDNIESVNPKLNRPFRLEVVLFEGVSSLNAYKMGVLEFPSSKNELQGANKTTYLSNWATVASTKAKLVIQKFDPTTALVWNGSYWDGGEVPLFISFGVELNIAGKLIYGASQGGWKPNSTGTYRITFYLAGSTVSLSDAKIGNYVGNEIVPVTEFSVLSEGGTAFPKVDSVNNLTYVDVAVVSGGGAGTK